MQKYRDGFRMDLDVPFVHPKQEDVLGSDDDIICSADYLAAKHDCTHCVHNVRSYAGNRPPKKTEKV